MSQGAVSTIDLGADPEVFRRELAKVEPVLSGERVPLASDGLPARPGGIAQLLDYIFSPSRDERDERD